MNIIIQVLRAALVAFEIILFARVIISWVRMDPHNPLVRFVIDMTEPVLRPIRNAIPPTGGFDLSMLILFLIIFALRRMLITLI